MYNPPANRIDETAMLHDLIERAAFGHVVSRGPGADHTDSAHAGAFAATGLPLLLDRATGPLGTLRGHFARANQQWKWLDGADVMVVMPLADGYVSPAWYPSKADDGRVVPTWNYEVIHVHGIAHIHDDAGWLLGLVSALTDRHEASRVDDAPVWQVSDAPDEFIARQIRAIVGVEIEITHLDGKRKLSQNRSDADRIGVIAGHEATGTPASAALAQAMRSTSGWSTDVTS